MLLQKLKEDIKQAMLSRDTTKRDILRVVVSSTDAIANSSNQAGKPVSDDQVIKVINETIKNNDEVLKLGENPKLEMENYILVQYLPKTLSVDEVYNELYGVKNALTLAKEGQAIGLAIKHFKELGKHVLNTDIITVVKSLRS